MMGKNKKDFYISHSGEFLIWLLVLCICVALFSLRFFIKEKNDHNTNYQVFLQDIDGLIVGSPVRMMGVQVGHVVKIKPMDDEIYVKFVLTNKDVYIPQGSALTVEFSGMAGSKSLELYLPQKNTYIDGNTPLITVESPKRLHDALGLLNDMFKKIGSIIYTTSDFGAKLKENDLIPKHSVNSSESMKNFVDYSNSFLDNSNGKVTDMRKSLEALHKNAR